MALLEHMIERFSIGSFLVQALISFCLLVFCFFHFDPFNELQVEADAVNMVLFGLFIPIIYSTATIFICILIGSPLNFSPRLRTWWASHQLLQLIIFSIGAGLLFLSLNENFRIDTPMEENGQSLVKSFSNTSISGSGWFLTAFIMLHAKIRMPDSIVSRRNWLKRPEQ